MFHEGLRLFGQFIHNNFYVPINGQLCAAGVFLPPTIRATGCDMAVIAIAKVSLTSTTPHLKARLNSVKVSPPHTRTHNHTNILLSLQRGAYVTKNPRVQGGQRHENSVRGTECFMINVV